MTYKIKNTKSNKEYVTHSVDGIFGFIKTNAPENFWDDTINDDNLDTDIYIYGETYSVADVLKQVNPVVYNNKVDEFWKEAKKDIIDFVSDIGEGETETLFGIFEVTVI